GMAILPLGDALQLGNRHWSASILQSREDYLALLRAENIVGRTYNPPTAGIFIKLGREFTLFDISASDVNFHHAGMTLQDDCGISTGGLPKRALKLLQPDVLPRGLFVNVTPP